MPFTAVQGGFQLSPDDEKVVNIHRAITKSINDAFIQVGAIYLSPSGKAPTDDENWYKRKFGDVNLTSWIDDPEQRVLNVGFNLQQGWVDIDIDSEDPEFNKCILRAAKHLRVDDRFQFGRRSMGCATHMLVQLPEDEAEAYEILVSREPKPFKLGGKRFHIQLRSSPTNVDDKSGPKSPKQTVVPGSIYTHKSQAGVYDLSVWYGSSGVARSHRDVAATTPRRVSFAEILRMIAFGTVLYILRPHWEKGARQDTAMKVGGWLARLIKAGEATNNDQQLAGEVFYPIDSVDVGKSLIKFVCDECGDDEAWKRVRVLDESYLKLERNPNAKIPGWIVMAELLGDECVEALRTVLTLGTDASALAGFSDRYIYNEDDNTYVDTVRFLTFGGYIHEGPDLERRHKSDKIFVNGKPKEAWKIFEQSKLRRQIGRTELMPDHEPGDIYRVNRMSDVIPEDAEDDTSLLVFNTWSGWPVKPAEVINPEIMANCNRHLDQLLKYLTRDNEKQAEWIKKWIAFTIQYPGTKQQIAWVMVGGQGVGKSWFGNKFMEALMGNLAGSATPTSIGEKFSIAPFLNRMVVFIDEARFRGEASTDEIKKLIRNVKTAGEEKFANAREYNVYARLIMASNRLDVNAGQIGVVDRALFFTRAYDNDHLQISELEFRKWAESLKPWFDEYTDFIKNKEVRQHYMRMMVDTKVTKEEIESIVHSSGTDPAILLKNLSWNQRVIKHIIEEGRVGGRLNMDGVVEGGADITAHFSRDDMSRMVEDAARKLGLKGFGNFGSILHTLLTAGVAEKLGANSYRFKWKMATLHDKVSELMGIPMEPQYEWTPDDYGPNESDGKTAVEWRGRKMKFGKF